MNKSFKYYFSVFLKGWLGSILIALLIATSFKSAFADWYIVPTGSMNPTIIEGDRVFVNKLAYDLKIPYTTCHIKTWDNPKRGDIVVFRVSPSAPPLVKRVVGMPGDIIEMRDNRLFVNGHALEYTQYDDNYKKMFADTVPDRDYLHEFYKEDLEGILHPVMITPDRQTIKTFKTKTIPEDKYLMMGDNRDNSADSRFFGLVDRKKILGQALAVVISNDLKNYYKPRWERFLTKIS